MKKFIFVFFALFSLLVINSKQKNDWLHDNLKGKVKSVTKFEYLNGKLNNKKITEFNKNGFILNSKECNEESGRCNNIIKIYNEGDINIETLVLDENNHIIRIMINEYDENGSLIKLYNYSKDILVIENDYHFDDEGNLLYMKENLLKENIAFEYNNKYDNNKNQIEHSRKSSDGQFNIKYINKYDENNLRIETIFYDNDKIKNINSYEYNDNGDVLKIIIKDIENNADQKITFNYKYDEYGNKILIEQYIKNFLTNKQELFSIEKYEYKYW